MLASEKRDNIYKTIIKRFFPKPLVLYIFFVTYESTYVVIPFNTVVFFAPITAAVQHLTFEIHVVSRFDSARIERVAQVQFHNRRVCKGQAKNKSCFYKHYMLEEGTHIHLNPPPG